MNAVDLLISAVVFAVFVPGVFFTLPKGGSKTTVLATHAVLFVVVMFYLVPIVRGYIEPMGNYGETCPNGYVMTPDGDCVAIGHETYPPTVTKSKTD
jgi:hypothetical protein